MFSCVPDGFLSPFGLVLTVPYFGQYFRISHSSWAVRWAVRVYGPHLIEHLLFLPLCVATAVGPVLLPMLSGDCGVQLSCPVIADNLNLVVEPCLFCKLRWINALI